jgi:hypothetical protein
MNGAAHPILPGKPYPAGDLVVEQHEKLFFVVPGGKDHAERASIASFNTREEAECYIALHSETASPFERSRQCEAIGPVHGKRCTRFAGHERYAGSPQFGDIGTDHEARDTQIVGTLTAQLIERWPVESGPYQLTEDEAVIVRAATDPRSPVTPSERFLAAAAPGTRYAAGDGEAEIIRRRFLPEMDSVGGMSAVVERELLAIAEDQSMPAPQRQAALGTLADEMRRRAAEPSFPPPLDEAQVAQRDIAAELDQVRELLKSAGFEPVDNFSRTGAPGSGLHYIELRGPVAPVILWTQILCGKPIAWHLLGPGAHTVESLREFLAVLS